MCQSGHGKPRMVNASPDEIERQDRMAEYKEVVDHFVTAVAGIFKNPEKPKIVGTGEIVPINNLVWGQAGIVRSGDDQHIGHTVFLSRFGRIFDLSNEQWWELGCGDTDIVVEVLPKDTELTITTTA